MTLSTSPDLPGFPNLRAPGDKGHLFARYSKARAECYDFFIRQIEMVLQGLDFRDDIITATHGTKIKIAIHAGNKKPDRSRVFVVDGEFWRSLTFFVNHNLKLTTNVDCRANGQPDDT